MKILALSISNFRGVREGQFTLSEHAMLVGPPGCGKSTVVDALSLILARDRMVRSLTEHDFFGSDPRASDRIRLVATIGGFRSNKPEDSPQWFGPQTAVPKWFDPATGDLSPTPTSGLLCAQIGYAARFDTDELSVQTLRYFHDSDDIEDPFQEDVVRVARASLVGQLGFYVLPALRTRDMAMSFGSELFRRAVDLGGAMPSESVLQARDDLRNPPTPPEADRLKELAKRINDQLRDLLPSRPEFQLRGHLDGLRVSAAISCSALQGRDVGHRTPSRTTRNCAPLPPDPPPAQRDWTSPSGEAALLHSCCRGTRAPPAPWASTPDCSRPPQYCAADNLHQSFSASSRVLSPYRHSDRAQRQGSFFSSSFA